MNLAKCKTTLADVAIRRCRTTETDCTWLSQNQVELNSDWSLMRMQNRCSFPLCLSVVIGVQNARLHYI